MGPRSLGAPKATPSLAPPRGLSGLVAKVGDHELAVLALPAPATSWSGLTRIEREVAVLVIRGLSNREIAMARGTSARTVAAQLASIYKKLGVGSRAGLVAATLGGG